MKVKVNWKVRFKNGVFLASFFSLIVSFVYAMLELFDIFPALQESTVLDIIQKVLMVLGMIGVVTDPTTAGIGDSQRALSYDKPWVDEEGQPFDQTPEEP